MTDQPIIYWQDEPNAISGSRAILTNADNPEYLVTLQRTEGDDLPFVLTRDQARDLGYALLARAIVTPETEQEQPVRKHYTVKVLVHVDAETPIGAESYVLDALLDAASSLNSPLRESYCTILETEEYIEHKDDRKIAGTRLG